MKTIAFFISICLITIMVSCNSGNNDEKNKNTIQYEGCDTIASVMNTPKCAVLEFSGAKSVSVKDIDGISEMFMTYFRPEGYTMIERAQINKVLGEQGFQRSSITDDQAVQVGKILNASKVILGKVSRLGGQYQVDVRVVDVELGHDIACEGAAFGVDFRGDVRNLATKLAYKIAIKPDGTPASTDHKPDTPIMIYGYLKVFPEDIGTFDKEPKTVISRLNQMQQYGYGTWRLPTKEELDLMRAKNIIGSGFYMTKETKTKRGIVRLVTDREKGETTPAVPQGYVDLGLPSGALWKDQNESGGFYTYDQAIAQFGDDLPTKEQLEELKNICQWTWTGSGYKVTGPSGKSITLPAAGCRYCDGREDHVGSDGYYYSSKLHGSNLVWYLYFNSRMVNMNDYSSCNGRSVRLVHD